jgi:hypothetical protein
MYLSTAALHSWLVLHLACTLLFCAASWAFNTPIEALVDTVSSDWRVCGPGTCTAQHMLPEFYRLDFQRRAACADCSVLHPLRSYCQPCHPQSTARIRHSPGCCTMQQRAAADTAESTASSAQLQSTTAACCGCSMWQAGLSNAAYWPFGARYCHPPSSLPLLVVHYIQGANPTHWLGFFVCCLPDHHRTAVCQDHSVQLYAVCSATLCMRLRLVTSGSCQPSVGHVSRRAGF